LVRDKYLDQIAPQLIRLDPGRADAYNNRGIAYGHLGDRDRAIADFSAAIRLAPRRRVLQELG
jgi:tetratricopeptide (TPR) repeat protein